MPTTRSLDGEVFTITGDEEALAVLEDMERKNGELKVAAVIEAATPKTSPLHPHFTWDKEEGFRKNLEKEARDLIRSYKIEVVQNDRVVQVPRFVSVESGKGRAYRRAEEVASVESFAETYIHRLIKELEALRDRLTAFEQFRGIVSAIDEAAASLATKE